MYDFSMVNPLKDDTSNGKTPETMTRQPPNDLRALTPLSTGFIGFSKIS